MWRTDMTSERRNVVETVSAESDLSLSLSLSLARLCHTTVDLTDGSCIRVATTDIMLVDNLSDCTRQNENNGPSMPPIEIRDKCASRQYLVHCAIPNAYCAGFLAQRYTIHPSKERCGKKSLRCTVTCGCKDKPI